MDSERSEEEKKERERARAERREERGSTQKLELEKFRVVMGVFQQSRRVGVDGGPATQHLKDYRNIVSNTFVLCCAARVYLEARVYVAANSWRATSKVL